jgi:hypothetical protein
VTADIIDLDPIRRYRAGKKAREAECSSMYNNVQIPFAEAFAACVASAYFSTDLRIPSNTELAAQEKLLDQYERMMRGEQ